MCRVRPACLRLGTLMVGRRKWLFSTIAFALSFPRERLCRELNILGFPLPARMAARNSMCLARMPPRLC
jgi:hypothetical protein